MQLTFPPLKGTDKVRQLCNVQSPYYYYIAEAEEHYTLH